jgi:hypothetical protein
VNVQKAVAKHISGGMTHCRANREAKYSERFVSVILSVGVTLVLIFLLLTFAMVFLQALDQWHK